MVDLGQLGPIRCQRCKAYMNAFMRWQDGGKSFVCNFCNHSNPCPDPYFCYLGPDNRRRDAEERAELSRGTYEVVATKEYMIRPPQPVIHVFLIDVSHPAVATAATAAACQCVEQVLDSLQGEKCKHDCATGCHVTLLGQAMNMAVINGCLCVMFCWDSLLPYQALAGCTELHG